MPPLIINFCPTGMVPNRSHTPFVPITPQEIIEQTHEAFQLGITIVHLHARDESGKPTVNQTIYAKIIEGVRKHCPGLVVCASSSGRSTPSFEHRSAVIELQPDMCSLTLSSLNFYDQASVNSPEMIKQLAEKMNAYGVKPELECFDLGMIHYGKHLADLGLIRGPFYWNLIFGNIAGFQATGSHMTVACGDLNHSKENFIGLGGIGKNQLVANGFAISHGYGVRIGLEDNIWYDAAKTQKASNIMLLKRIHALMKQGGRELFKSSEFGQKGFYNANSFARVQ